MLNYESWGFPWITGSTDSRGSGASGDPGTGGELPGVAATDAFPPAADSGVWGTFGRIASTTAEYALSLLNKINPFGAATKPGSVQVSAGQPISAALGISPSQSSSLVSVLVIGALVLVMLSVFGGKR